MGRSRYHICLYIHRYILGGSRLRKASEARNLSLIALSPSVLSLFVAQAICSLASPSCARGIKYNKDIQWELIGYLPIYRSLSAYCCVASCRPRQYNAGVQGRCRDATPRRAGACATRLLSSSILSLFFSFAPPLRFFFFHRYRLNRDIPWQNNIADHVFSGRNASPHPRYRYAASVSRRRTSAFFCYPAIITNPYASSAT